MTDAFINSFPGDPSAQANLVETPAEIKPLSWIEIFTGVLTAPFKTMRELAVLSDAKSAGIGAAALAVIIPFALDGARMTAPDHFEQVFLNLVFSVTMGVLLWLSLAGVCAVSASVFGAPANFCRRVFVLVGWSYAPWILMAPIFCYRELLGPAFPLFATIPLAWVGLLHMLAIKESFELKWSKLLLLVLLVPFLYQSQQLMRFIQSVYVSLSSLS